MTHDKPSMALYCPGDDDDNVDWYFVRIPKIGHSFWGDSFESKHDR